MRHGRIPSPCSESPVISFRITPPKSARRRRRPGRHRRDHGQPADRHDRLGDSADATYSVTVGSTGTFPYGTDTPASPYIDKDGTFYFQQSVHPVRRRDHARPLLAVLQRHQLRHRHGEHRHQRRGQPGQPPGQQRQHRWRCDNSPTGVTATAGLGGYPLDDYCDLIGTWVDPDTGNWYGLVHNEFTGQPVRRRPALRLDRLRASPPTRARPGRSPATRSPRRTAPSAATPPRSRTRPTTTATATRGCSSTTASGYFYLDYGSRIVPKGGVGGSTDWLAHVARAPITGKMATGTWQKWYDGSWSQPGVGGLESNMVPVTSGEPHRLHAGRERLQPGQHRHRRPADRRRDAAAEVRRCSS